jgi:hypothetical protein
MTQPIVAGVAAFVLLGFAVQTTGWRYVSARQARLVIGFAVAAVLAAVPMVLFVALTVLVCVVVIAIALTILFMLFKAVSRTARSYRFPHRYFGLG